MDVKDISDLNEYAAFFKQLLERAELAAARKGEIPRDHPPAQQLATSFIWKIQARLYSPVSMGENKISTTQVPTPYPPCTQAARDLQPIMIHEMKLETHHRSKKTLLRVLTPPDRINAVMAIVEDERGTAVLLQLYHMPEESVVPAEEILRKDRVCILKEPFFKATTIDGSYSLRVDHVSDIVWLADDDEHVPAKWRRRRRQLSMQNTSLELRTQGNKSVLRKKWAEAERLYSLAISSAGSPEEARLAHLNRSLANLRLGRIEDALSDARRGGQGEKVSEKALFRDARALYETRRYKECMKKLVILAKEFPENNAVKPEMDRTQARLREQQTGEYSFTRMYEQTAADIPIIDCATFCGPIEVRPSPGRGRGLFTTRAVAAGELLVCEKAFGYSYAGDDQPIGLRNTKILMDVDSRIFTIGGQAQLITQIVQRLQHNPELSREFLDLHHGKYDAVSVCEVDGRPVVDSFLVAKTIITNSFGAPRTTRAGFRAATSDAKSEDKGSDSFTTCGIWNLASQINHSCVTNCRRSLIGDMMIIRATRDIAADTELFFSYKLPEPMSSYDKTQEQLKNWGFRCDCALCLDKKATSDDALRTRKGLFSQLKLIMRPSIDPRSINMKRALAVLEKMEATYSTPTRKEPARSADLESLAPEPMHITPRLELWDPYFAFGRLFLSTGKSSDAVKMTIKGLEALGFIIIATPPGRSGSWESKKASVAPQLKIKCWGQVNDFVVTAFLTLFQAYRPTSPELAHIARGYFAIAYSMVVGEKETAFEEFPEIL